MPPCTLFCATNFEFPHFVYASQQHYSVQSEVQLHQKQLGTQKLRRQQQKHWNLDIFVIVIGLADSEDSVPPWVDDNWLHYWQWKQWTTANNQQPTDQSTSEQQKQNITTNKNNIVYEMF